MGKPRRVAGGLWPAWLAAAAVLLGSGACTDDGTGHPGTRIIAFEASAYEIVNGGQVTLTWDAVGAGIHPETPPCSVSSRYQDQPADEVVAFPVSCQSSQTFTIEVPDGATYVRFLLAVAKRPYDPDDPYLTRTLTVDIVEPIVTVSLDPESAIIPVRGTVALNASVTGGSDDGLNWSASCGDLATSEATALFTAPDFTGACIVTASSRALPAARASAVVEVSAAGNAFVTRAGGVNNDFGTGVVALPDGGMVVTGVFQGTAVLGRHVLTGQGETDVYVARITHDGRWQWATAATGRGFVWIHGVTRHPDGGAVVTGQFAGEVTFGDTMLASSGSDDVYVARIDAAGTWVWATSAGGSGSDVATAVTATHDGHAVVTGWFSENASFGDTSLSSAGRIDAFVARIDGEGRWLWAIQGTGAFTVRGNAIDAMPDGSVVIAGTFVGTATFGANVLERSGSANSFVARVSAGGAWLWVDGTDGSGTVITMGVRTRQLDTGESVILIAGTLTGVGVFGDLTYVGGSSGDAYFAGLNADSGAWLGAFHSTATGAITTRAIAIQPDGGVVVAGHFEEEVTFGTHELRAVGGRDVFVARFFSNWSWANQYGGSGTDRAIAIDVFTDGAIAVTGTFTDEAVFDGVALASQGLDDVFVLRIADVDW